MTDAQLISISITVLAIMAGAIYNNVRISDLRSDMNSRFVDVGRRIDDSATLLRAEMRVMQAETNTQFERINSKFDVVLKMLADIDQRVTALETRK